MQRTNRLYVLVTEAERKAIEAWAHEEKLPASVAARRLLLLEIEKRGFHADDYGAEVVE